MGEVAFIHQTVRFVYVPVIVDIRVAEIKMNISIRSYVAKTRSVTFSYRF